MGFSGTMNLAYLYYSAQTLTSSTNSSIGRIHRDSTSSCIKNQQKFTSHMVITMRMSVFVREEHLKKHLGFPPISSTTLCAWFTILFLHWIYSLRFMHTASTMSFDNSEKKSRWRNRTLATPTISAVHFSMLNSTFEV